MKRSFLAVILSTIVIFGGKAQKHHGFYFVPTVEDINAFKNSDSNAPRTLNCWVTPMLIMPMEIQGLEPTEATIGNKVSLSVPDKFGANIKGVVYCGEYAVAGAVVSDGTDVTITDADGRYYLKSTKANQNVFISVPSGYSVKNDGIWPKFYSKIDPSVAVTDQVNFELVKNDKTDYVVIGLADIHIANAREMPRQFNDNFLPDITKTITGYKNQGKDVYIMALGDQSHDLYWYDAGGIDLEGSKDYLSRINCTTMFTTMGNHDNDPYVADDFSAENRYRASFGPTHYSYNIAGTHYIMLDNIVYVNEGGKQGTLGERNYQTKVTADQLAWLKKDLATVDPQTPVVLGMHAPMWRNALLPSGSQTPSLTKSLSNFDDLYACLEGYSVTILSGHAHINSTNRSGNIVEYNAGSAAGRLWASGQSSLSENHLCGDGSGGGYLVIEKNGTENNAYYKSVNHDKSYQFRTYDLNNSQITAAKFCPKSTESVLKASIDAKYLKGYDTARTDNVVQINVFNFNDRWKINVTENGRSLPVTRINGYDPLWTISVPCLMLNNRQKLTNSSFPAQTSHMFEVQASSPTSTLEIEVTDEWGNVYKQTMTRPKELKIDMK